MAALQRRRTVRSLVNTNTGLLLKASLLLLIMATIAVYASLIWSNGGISGSLFTLLQSSSTADLSNAPLVAIVSCIKSKGYSPSRSIKEFLLPSIHATITKHERASYRVELILAYDEDDSYWQHRSNQLDVIDISRRDGTNEQPIPVSFLLVRKQLYSNSTHNNIERPNRIPFNELCQAAYDHGATYIVRINDDTHFMTSGWISLAVSTLQSYSPPNVGVVGPTCRQGNEDILTHDMVHAPTHYEIFDTYYPDLFDNYYIDDWMTQVYGERRTTKLKQWEVFHSLDMYGTRYTPSFDQDQFLEEEIQKGRQQVERFVQRQSSMIDARRDSGIKGIITS